MLQPVTQEATETVGAPHSLIRVKTITLPQDAARFSFQLILSDALKGEETQHTGCISDTLCL